MSVREVHGEHPDASSSHEIVATIDARVPPRGLIEYIAMAIAGLPNGGGVTFNEARRVAAECAYRYVRDYPAIAASEAE